MASRFLSIAIIGVHGSGKTTTATLLADELGFRYVEVEEVYDVEELGIKNPVHRQIVFVTGYTRTFIAEYYRSRHLEYSGVVFDSHPVLNIPYIEYWVGGARGRRLARTQLALVHFLPRVDLGVLLDVDDVDVVIERIRRRGRSVADMEANVEYIEYVADGLRRVFRHLPARQRVVIPASLEVEERVEKIIGAINMIREDPRRDQQLSEA